MTKQYNYIIIGAGIIGLSLALKLKEKFPRVTVLILDKEEDTGGEQLIEREKPLTGLK